MFSESICLELKKYNKLRSLFLEYERVRSLPEECEAFYSRLAEDANLFSAFEGLLEEHEELHSNLETEGVFYCLSTESESLVLEDSVRKEYENNSIWFECDPHPAIKALFALDTGRQADSIEVLRCFIEKIESMFELEEYPGTVVYPVYEAIIKDVFGDAVEFESNNFSITEALKLLAEANLLTKENVDDIKKHTKPVTVFYALDEFKETPDLLTQKYFDVIKAHASPSNVAKVLQTLHIEFRKLSLVCLALSHLATSDNENRSGGMLFFGAKPNNTSLQETEGQQSSYSVSRK